MDKKLKSKGLAEAIRTAFRPEPLGCEWKDLLARFDDPPKRRKIGLATGD